MPHADHWATGSGIAALSLRHPPANGPSSGCFARNYPPGRVWPPHIAVSCRKRIPGPLQFSGSIYDGRVVQMHSNWQSPLQAERQP